MLPGSPGGKQETFANFLYRYTEAGRKGQIRGTTQLGSLVVLCSLFSSCSFKKSRLIYFIKPDQDLYLSDLEVCQSTLF